MSTQYDINDRPHILQEALHNIANWLLTTVAAEPGWSELVLDIKPMAGSTIVRITENRGTESYVGSTGPLRPDALVLRDINTLQKAAYDEAEGTWLTASVIIAATGWPTPVYKVGASYNRQDDPQDWGGEGRMTARELRAHLMEYPRAEGQLPEWAIERLAGRREPKTFINAGEHEIPNQYLATALREFNIENLDYSVINVLRTLLGGDVLLDISDSKLVPLGESAMGPRSEIRYQVLRLANGLRALSLYSSSEHATAQHQKRGGEGTPMLLRESGIKTLIHFVEDASLDLIVLDPGTSHEAFIEKPQAAWVLTVPRNDGIKNALMNGKMDQLLKAITAPSSILNIGVHPDDPFTPVFVPAEGRDEPDTLLLFTSAPEVSALDPALNVQTLSAIDALKMANDIGAKHVRLNALNPSATLPMSQVRKIIESMDGAGPVL